MDTLSRPSHARDAAGGWGAVLALTYLRPFLETVTGVSVLALSLILLGMGGAGLVGTWLVGRAVARSLAATLILAP